MDKLTIEESRLKEIVKEATKEAFIEVLEEMIAHRRAEDLEDAKEVAQLRQANEEAVSWDQAQAELRAGGVKI